MFENTVSSDSYQTKPIWIRTMFATCLRVLLIYTLSNLKWSWLQKLHSLRVLLKQKVIKPDSRSLLASLGLRVLLKQKVIKHMLKFKQVGMCLRVLLIYTLSNLSLSLKRYWKRLRVLLVHKVIKHKCRE